MSTLFTIGHSAHTLEKFVNLLELYSIQAVLDVRSVPASRFYPHFAKRNLSDALAREGIWYVFLGRELGGRPSDPACYVGGVLPEKTTRPWPRPDYARVMEQGWFVRGIERLLRYAAERRSAILCSEEDPKRCHRHLLIARYLLQQHPDIEVLHIRGNGAAHNADEIRHGEAVVQQLGLF